MATTNETVDIRINGSGAVQALRNIERNVDMLTNGFREFMAGVAEGMTSAARNVDKLRDSTQKMSQANRDASQSTSVWANTISRFGAVIAGVGIGAFVNSTRIYAQQIQNAASATGVATDVVQQFANSVARSGGQVDNAVESVIEFSEKINEARNGNEEMIRTFEQAGVSLKELYSGDTQAIFKKTLEGMTRIGDATIRNTASAKLLGEQFKKIDVRTVAGGMSISGNVASASAIKAAADAQANLNAQLQNLTNAIINVTEPLNKFLSSINITASAFESLIKAVLAGGAAFLYFTRFAAPIAGIIKTTAQTISKVLRSLVTPIKTIAALWEAAVGVIILALTKLGNFMKYVLRTIFGDAIKMLAAGKFQTAIKFMISGIMITISRLAKLIVRFAGVVGIVYAVAEAINFLVKVFFKFDILDSVTGKFSKLIDKVKEWFGLQKNAPKFGTQATEDRGGDWAEKLAKETEDAAKAAQERAEQLARAQWSITAALIKQRDDLEAIIRQYKQTNRQTQLDLQTQISLVGATEDRVELTNALIAADSSYYDQLRQIENKHIELRNAVKYALKDSAEQKQAAAELAEFERIRISLVTRLSEAYAEHRDRIIDGVRQLQTARVIENERLNILQRMNDAYERQRNITSTLSNVFRELAERRGDLQFERSLMGQGGFARDLLSQRRELDKLYAEQSQAIAETFSIDGEFDSTRAKEYAAAIAQLAQRFRELKEITNNNAAASRRWSTGWNEALENFIDNATNMADIARDVFGNMMGAMENALDNFVRTGKLGFKDLVRSIVLDLTSMALKQAFRNLFIQMAMAKGGFLGSIGSFLGTLIGAGPLNSGPGAAGRASAATASPTIINNYNISAIDSRSVAQFFAENRRTAYGAVMQAQKEMPTRVRGGI